MELLSSSLYTGLKVLIISFADLSAITLQIASSSNRHVRFHKKKLSSFFLPLAAESHLLLDLGNGLTRVKTLGAGSGTVKNGMAPVQAHGVLEVLLSLGGALVTRIGEPSVRLKQDSGTKVLLRVPPV